MAASNKIPTTFTAEDKFTKVIKTMTRATKDWSRSGIAAVNRFDAKLSKSFKKMGSMAKLAIGASAGFIARDAIETVKNYEQSVADLNAVMNTNDANQRILQADAKRLGAITSKSATEVVGLQEAYARLGFETEHIVNMTEATINGSVAMNAELSRTAELTGAVVKTFDSLSSIDAPDILDKMTLSTQKSALNFEKLETALPIVGGAANAAGISFENTLALLGKLSDAGIDASSSSTALRNIFLDSAAKGHSYTQVLENIEKNQEKLTAANDEFGKRGAVSAVILSGKLGEINDLTNELTDNFKGTAQAAADTRLNTFGGSLKLLESAYEGLLLKTNDNTGALGILKSMVDFVTRNIETLAVILASVIGLFAAMKVIVIATKVAMFAYNIAVGISAARTGAMAIAMKVNTVAIAAYTVASKAMTAAQWLLNIAMDANPIGLVIIAIAALIGLIALVINKYDEWGASLALMLGPLGWIINLVQSFRRNWDNIKKAFSEGGILAGLKAIGDTILDSLLMPMRQFLGLIENIPGIGGLATIAIDGIDKIRENLNVVTDDGQGNETLPSTTQASNENVSRTISESNNNIKLDIIDKGGNVGNVSQDGNIPVSIGNTSGQN